MDSILHFLNGLRESQYWPVYKVLLTALFALVMVGAPMLVGAMAVCRDELYGAVREAFRLAGVSNTAAAIDARIGESLASKKLRGEKPLTLDFLAMQDAAVLQFLGLNLIQHYGLPPIAMTATRVQARMALPSVTKQEIA